MNRDNYERRFVEDWNITPGKKKRMKLAGNFLERYEDGHLQRLLLVDCYIRDSYNHLALDEEGLQKAHTEVKKILESTDVPKEVYQQAQEYNDQVCLGLAKSMKDTDSRLQIIEGMREGEAKAMWKVYLESLRAKETSGDKRLEHLAKAREISDICLESGHEARDYYFAAISKHLIYSWHSGDQQTADKPEHYRANELLANCLLNNKVPPRHALMPLQKAYEQVVEMEAVIKSRVESTKRDHTKSLRSDTDSAWFIKKLVKADELKSQIEKDKLRIQDNLTSLYRHLAHESKKTSDKKSYFLGICNLVEGDVEANLWLGRISFVAGDYADALDKYEKVATILWDSSDDDAYAEHKEALFAGGDMAGLLFCYHQTSINLAKHPSIKIVEKMLPSQADKDVYQLILKTNQAAHENIDIRSPKKRISHFGYDPLKTDTKNSLIMRLMSAVEDLTKR